VMIVVGQDLCDGRKHSPRHLLVSPPHGSFGSQCVVNVLSPSR
jgi:hypothetical protein